MSEETVVRLPARDLSSQEHKDRVALCEAIDGRVKKSIRAGRKAYWETARALYEFKEENGWTALGFGTQTEWLEQPEVALSERTYLRMVRTWRELAVMRKVDPPTLAGLDISKVDIVLPALEWGDVPLKSAFDDVRSLTARQLRAKYPSSSPASIPPPSLTVVPPQPPEPTPIRPLSQPPPAPESVPRRVADPEIEAAAAARRAAGKLVRSAVSLADDFERNAHALPPRDAMVLALKVVDRWERACDTAGKAAREDEVPPER